MASDVQSCMGLVVGGLAEEDGGMVGEVECDGLVGEEADVGLGDIVQEPGAGFLLT